MIWHESWRADPTARRIADGHYTRQKVGADQFVPPGRCVVLVIPGAAYWVTSWPFPQYVKHAWPGAWLCSAFRNLRRCQVCGAEVVGPCPVHPTARTVTVARSSLLITQAIAATRYYWSPPPEGMITFVNAGKVSHKRDPGRCFLRAGFHATGKGDCTCRGTPTVTDTEGHIVLHLAASAMPAAQQPLGAQSVLAIEGGTR